MVERGLRVARTVAWTLIVLGPVLGAGYWVVARAAAADPTRYQVARTSLMVELITGGLLSAATVAKPMASIGLALGLVAIGFAILAAARPAAPDLVAPYRGTRLEPGPAPAPSFPKATAATRPPWEKAL